MDAPLGEDVVGSGHTAVVALLAKASARLNTIDEQVCLQMIDLIGTIRLCCKSYTERTAAPWGRFCFPDYA
jgi:hypothetical protein